MSAKHVAIFTGGRRDDRLCAAVGAIPGVRVTGAREHAELLAALRDADALVTTVVGWDAELAAALAGAPKLEWVQALNTGIDNMEAFGIPARLTVSNLGPVSSTVVAEHALALLLALLRRLPALAAAQERREWAFRAEAGQMATLRGKHVAVLGFGYIGRRIAELVIACGARVTAVATRRRTEPGGIAVEPMAELQNVVAAADALVVAAPLTAATHGLVGRDVLRAMRRGSLLVNISRGKIVVTDEVVAALDEGIVAGAALDVTDPEPLPPEHPLWTRSNAIVSPHVAGQGGGEAVRAELEALVVENVRRFAAGRELLHVVRKP